jgi:NADH dehydrogenase
MTYRTLVVIGGSGFVGSHLVALLAAQEQRDIIVPTRRYERARHLLPLPHVVIAETDVNDERALAQLLPGADAVINLVGILHSKPGPVGSAYGPGFARAHVELPQRIVAACAAHGVGRYLHMSALGAAADGPSMYQRSKAEGEQAVRSNPAVAATIFRPSVIFGPDDHFLNRFAALQRLFPLMPLAGADARFQPIYVDDVACAFIAALECDQTIGETYELAGPTVYTLRELVRLAGIWSGHPRPVIGLPPALARLQAWVLEHLPGEPLMSRDNLDSMKSDNVAAAPIAPILGIEPVAMEAVAPYYLAGKTPRSGVHELPRHQA